MSNEGLSELAELRKKNAAQAKMLKVLINRAERASSAGVGALDRLREMHDLEQMVAFKTSELEAESSKLLDTLIRLHNTQEQLVQAQKLEAIGQLAAGIAHDFNNWLTVILGNADFLINALPEDTEASERVGEICLAAEKAAALTRQLLAFSRKQALSPELLDLNKVILLEKDILQRLIGNDIDLITKLRPDLGQIRFDPTQIEQIIMNLVVNARDAMPQGGKLTIKTSEVGTEGEGRGTMRSSILLSVSDTGIGMDAETRSKIFEPFFTTKGLGKGTGLGLSTVYGIVKQSGGNIFVDSKPGRGTTFRIYLPTTEDTADVLTFKARPGVPPAESESILLVDDNEAVRRVARAILESDGYTVFATGDTSEALLICRGHRGEIDLLLTDIIMPKKDGQILAKEALAIRPSLKVVYMSGYFEGPHSEACQDIPSAQLVMKPFTLDGLLSKVRGALIAPRSKDAA